MPIIEFTGESKAGSTARPSNSSRLLNLYREPVPNGGLSRYILRVVPGQVALVDLGAVFQRQLAWVDNTTYSAAGGALYSVTSAGVTANLGAIKDSEETTISGNTGYVTICAGGRYYVLDGGALSQPATGAFSDFGSVDTLENYTMLTERNGRRIQWSNPADPSTLDGLSFATTEAGPDNCVRGMSLNGNYWVFKERSTEIWYPTGISTGAFARIGGGVLEVGLKSFNLAAKGRDMLFFVGNDGIAYMTAGQDMQPISTRSVERDIRVNDPTHCFYYEWEGHKFCVIRFSDRPAWVYDFATAEWHERSEGVNHGPWDAVASVANNSGQWLIGATLGGISRLDDVRTDKGSFLYRQATSHTLRMDGARFRVPEVEIYGAYGYAPVPTEVEYYLDVGGGYLGLGSGFFCLESIGSPEPKMTVSVSRDSGATWGNSRIKDMGAEGDYEQRIILRALGQFRNITIKMDMSHDYEIPIYSDGRVKLA